MRWPAHDVTRENFVMSAQSESSILLHRIDASRNMKRFYVMATMPNLFG